MSRSGRPARAAVGFAGLLLLAAMATGASAVLLLGRFSGQPLIYPVVSASALIVLEVLLWLAVRCLPLSAEGESRAGHPAVLPPAQASPGSAVEERQRNQLFQVLHDLNQPLTSLHCCLELGLRGRLSGRQYRAALQQALANADRVVRLLCLVRELLESSQPGQNLELVPLDAILRQTVSEFILPAQEQGVRIALHYDPGLYVQATSPRLARVLSYLLESGLRRTPAGATLELRAEARGREVMLRLESRLASAPEDLPLSPAPALPAGEQDAVITNDPGLAVAGTILAALGGSLQQANGVANFTARLPLATGSVARPAPSLPGAVALVG